MATGKKQKGIIIPQPKKVTAQLKKDSSTIFDRTERWLDKNYLLSFITIVAFALLFSVLLFDVKISEANDDSLYIEGGFNFAQDIHTPFTANAPLYPLLLSVPIKFFGINLILLKSISTLFFLLHFVVFFFAFRKRIPNLVLFPLLLIISVNSYYLYFASQTFTECLYILLQAFLFYIVLRLPDVVDSFNAKKLLPFLFAGFALFIIGFCKNIAIGAVVAVIIYFLFQKKFKHVLLIGAGYALVRIPAELIRNLVWPSQNQFSSQSGILRQKDAYDASKGYEDVSGFIQRFMDNTGLYIGKRLYQIFGFVPASSIEIKGGFVFIFLLLLIPGIIFMIKRKQRTVQLAFLYSMVMLGLTFTVLQKNWDQPRMILVYVGIFMVVILYGLYELLKKQPSFLQSFYFLFVGLLFFSCFFSTITKATKNYNTLTKNFAGDIYYGYTPDWINFLKMSKYSADSLPENSFVASRKAPMSFVYSNGKKFFPVYTVYSHNADSVLNYFKENKVSHVILASIRRNPKKSDGYVINTLHRMLMPVSQKYPDKLNLVKQIGETESAYLYQIKY